MAWSEACSKLFSAQEKSRGASYFQSSRVRDVVVHADARVATGIVRGSQNYAVSIDWEEAHTSGGVVVHCDCPYAESRVTCKHLFAFMLELDKRRAIGDLPRNLFLTSAMDDESVDDDDDGIALSEFAFGVPRRPAPRPQPSSQEKIPVWKSQLRDLAQVGFGQRTPGFFDARPGKRVVLYVIDVALSHQSKNLVLRLLQQERKINGEFGKPTKLTLTSAVVDAYRGTPDAELLDWLLITARTVQIGYGYYSSYSSYSGFSEFTLPSVVLSEILPRLAATQRLLWGLNPEPPIKPGDVTAVVWDEHPAWRLKLVVQTDESREFLLLSGRLVSDADPVGLPLSQTVFASAKGVVLWTDRIASLEATGQQAWLDLLRQQEHLEIPFAQRGEFLKDLLALPTTPVIDWPAELCTSRHDAEPRGHLRVFSPVGGYGPKPELYAKVSFDYDGTLVSWNDARRAVYNAEQNCVIERRPEREQQLLAMLGRQGVRQPSGYQRDEADFTFPSDFLANIVQRLPIEAWIVEAEGNVIRRPGAFRMNVSSGVDWFELSGECDFGGEAVALPDILAAVRKGENFVRLGDGSRGLLPETWLAKYGAVLEMAEEKDGKLQFKPTQAMILDALLAAHETTTVDRKFKDFRRKMSSFDGIKPVTAPRGFTGELRPYQNEGLAWLKFLQDFRFGGCLADDMGLGKTVQVLALLENRRTRRPGSDEVKRPSLIVVPRSLIYNWRQEAARFAPKLRVLDFSEKSRKEQWQQVADHDVVLTTYGTMLRDITQLHELEFDYVILDEAQAIKNTNSQSAKACRLLRATHRLALTGTPIENHIGELWSIVEFLNPGMLGKAAAFSKLTVGNGSTEEQAAGRELIAKAIRPILLRRTKQQVLDDLPAKSEQTIFCDLSKSERKKYDELRDFYRASLSQKIGEVGLEKSKIHVLEALLRLRQASCHLGLLDAKLRSSTSAKLAMLFEQMDELISENHKALVFSQFTQLLGIVKEHLDAKKITYEYLDGQTRDRQKRVERFQNDPDCPLFLVSLKAGGRGLNLTAADYVFILDPWWNPAVEAQAIDRAHRMGQTKPVFAYRLIARDTVEEKILELQSSKRELADSIISADSSVLKNLTAEDLRMLLD